MTLFKQGRTEEAVVLAKRAVALREKALGPQHVQTAESLSNLAFLLTQLSQPKEAERIARLALAAFESAGQMERPAAAMATYNLARACWLQDKLAEAEPAFKRCLSQLEKMHGPVHEELVPPLDLYAQLLRRVNRTTEAEILERRRFVSNYACPSNRAIKVRLEE